MAALLGSTPASPYAATARAVELHQWPGTFHGSQAILSAEISQRQNAELAAALRRALAE